MNIFPTGVSLAVLCGLQAGCASVPRPSSALGAPAGDGEAGCEEATPAAEYAHALVRIACDGSLMPGRATWSLEGSVVTLEFPPGGEGPVGAELVQSWPLLSAPPWLGHSVESITVIEGDGVQVRFTAPADEPARLFADPRLSGTLAPAPVEGDARDAIDAGTARVVTHHAASIEYARSLGREVRLAGFDRLYLVVFAVGADGARTEHLSAGVAGDWIGWGVPGTRRLPANGWASLTRRCEADGSEPAVGAAAGDAAAGDAAAGDAAGGDAPPRAVPMERPTVSFEEGDLPGRQAAERIVSAGMRGGAEAEILAELTGSSGRLAVRGTGEAAPGRAPSDVAAVLRVRAGPGHPCSLHAEVLQAIFEWGAREGPGQPPHVILLGELAAFAVGVPGAVQP